MLEEVFVENRGRAQAAQFGYRKIIAKNFGRAMRQWSLATPTASWYAKVETEIQHVAQPQSRSSQCIALPAVSYCSAESSMIQVNGEREREGV